MLILERGIDQRDYIEIPPSDKPTRIMVMVTRVKWSHSEPFVGLGIEAPMGCAITRPDMVKNGK